MSPTWGSAGKIEQKFDFTLQSRLNEICSNLLGLIWFANAKLSEFFRFVTQLRLLVTTESKRCDFGQNLASFFCSTWGNQSFSFDQLSKESKVGKIILFHNLLKNDFHVYLKAEKSILLLSISIFMLFLFTKCMPMCAPYNYILSFKEWRRSHIFLKVLINMYCIILMLLTLVFGAIRNI